MPSLTEALPMDDKSGRSPEEKMLAAKILLHIADYVKALATYGPDFMSIDVDPDHPLCGCKSGGQRNGQAVHQNNILANGQKAYSYIFIDDDNIFGFVPVCMGLDINIRFMRNALRNMTQERAMELTSRMRMPQKDKKEVKQ